MPKRVGRPRPAKAGNFRRRPRSNPPVTPSHVRHVLARALGRVRPRVAAALENGTMVFFGVVLVVALLFRVGIGLARAGGPAAEAESASTTRPADPRTPPKGARKRADASGVATVTAVTRGRARALAAPAPSAAAPSATAAGLERPSPSFLRARSDFEHRHVDPLGDARPPKLARPRQRAPRTR